MKKLLLLISLFSVSCAFGMNPNASDGKQEANDDQPTAAARASASASAAATAPIDHDKTGEETVSLTFADNEDATRELKLQYANCAQTLNDFLSVFGEAAATPTTIPLPISAADFDLLAPYWETVFQISIALDDHAKAEYTKQLIEQLFQVTDKAQLGTIITGADYLGIQALVDCGLHVAHDQLVAEIDFNSFMDEEALQNYNPYELNENLNRQLAALLVEPAAHYLENQTTHMHALTGHNDIVMRGCFSPDGKTILIRSRNSAVKLWDLEGNCLQTLSHTGGRFSPDGNTILTTSNDNTAKLWDREGNCLQTLTGHTGPIWSSCFSPDGNTILTTSYDHTAKLWDREGNCLHTLTGHTNCVDGGCFSPDGNTTLTTSRDRTAKLWDREGNCLQTLTGHTNSASGCFSPDSNTILTTSSDRTAKLWDREGNCLQTLSHTGLLMDGWFSPDGNTILTISCDRTAKLWDREGNCLHTLTGHTGPVMDGCFSPDGNTILTTSEDHTAKLWDREGNCLHTLTGHTDWIMDGCFNPDGNTILTISRDNIAKLWERYPQEAQQLKQNCALPQTLLLLHALHQSRLQQKLNSTSATAAAASNETDQIIPFALHYPETYKSFNCSLLKFLEPLLGAGTHCLACKYALPTAASNCGSNSDSDSSTDGLD